MRASFHDSFVDELEKIAISPEAARRTAEELEKAKREEKGEKPPAWKNKEKVTSVGKSAPAPEPPKAPSTAVTVPPSTAVVTPPPPPPSKPKSFKESAEASEAATKAGIEKLKGKLSLFRKGKELLTEGAGAAAGAGKALGQTRVPMFLKRVGKAALKVPGKAWSGLKEATELPPVKAPDSEGAQRLFELARRRGAGA